MSNITLPLLIQGGLALIITNVWSNTGKSIIDHYYPYGTESVVAKLMYAIILTVIIMLVIWSIQNMSVNNLNPTNLFKRT